MAESAVRVLVADDERFFRDAICEALSDASIAYRTAESSDEVLALAEEPDVGVVLLDVGLPGLGSAEVIRRLAKERPGLPVLVLSSHTDQDRVLEALRLGACDYLAKPLHDEELVLAVGRALSAHRLRARLDALNAGLEALGAALESIHRADRANLTKAAAAATAVVLRATRTSLMLLDTTRDVLRVVAAIGNRVPLVELAPVAAGAGVAGFVLASQRVGAPLIVEDVDADPRFAAIERVGQYETGSFAVAPLHASGRPVGVLCATDREGGEPFDGEAWRLMRILALQLGPALDRAAESPEPVAAPAAVARAGLTELDVDERGDDAELARSICEALTAEVEPERLIDAALRAVARSVPSSAVSLYLVDPKDGSLVLEWQVMGGAGDRDRLPAGVGLTGLVAATGRLVAAPAPERDPRFVAAVDTPEGGRAAPLLCVPVQLRGKTLGVLRVFPEDAPRASARTGEVLAAAISAAVRNVLMYRSLLESVDDVARARRETQGQSPS